MRKGSSKGVFSKDSPKRASIIQADELYTGWLQKQSHGPIKKLQSRFFEISGHYLKYYDSAFPRNAETLKGFFDLREVKSISRNGSDIVIWGKADQQLKVRVGSLPLSLLYCCTTHCPDPSLLCYHSWWPAAARTPRAGGRCCSNAPRRWRAPLTRAKRPK
jgi:hypothetical protein